MNGPSGPHLLKSHEQGETILETSSHGDLTPLSGKDGLFMHMG